MACCRRVLMQLRLVQALEGPEGSQREIYALVLDRACLGLQHATLVLLCCSCARLSQGSLLGGR